MYSANLAFREVKSQPVSGERARAAALKARTLSSPAIRVRDPSLRNDVQDHHKHHRCGNDDSWCVH
jgi:hypothetical protein